jgi:hypothetical protein
MSHRLGLATRSFVNMMDFPPENVYSLRALIQTGYD